MTVAEFVKNIGGCFMIRIKCAEDLLYEGLAQDFRRCDRSGISDRRISRIGAEVYKHCEGLYEGCVLICVWRH
jgi:hypothetical protein